MLYASVFWINIFPAADGISNAIIPQSMLTVMKIHFSHHCLIVFVEYVHTHYYGYNSIEARTIEALYLQPTVNSQGGHYFLNHWSIQEYWPIAKVVMNQ